MNSFDDTLEDVELSIHGRKKRADKSMHAREVVKRAKLSSGGKIPMRNCQHRADDGFCWAECLSSSDLELNQEKFHQQDKKVDQDAYLLRLLHIANAKRSSVKEEERKKQRTTSTIFHLLTSQDHGKVRVCKATFCSVLGISQDRVTRVARYFNQHKEARPENRGGRRNAEKDEEKRAAVIAHIKTFKCKPSHYSRRTSPGRKYLPCDLNVAKMHALFKDHSHQTVSYALYYSVFTSRFNLGFGHPASDVCGTCLQFRSKIKDTSLSEDQKKVLAAEFILHRRKARMFYNSLNAVGDSLTICFDVMENLVLPKTPVGQAYYSRQLYMYIFGIVIHRADGTQHTPDIHLYTWQENENRKDSNMIASAVSNFLTKIAHDHLIGTSHLRLFSDSCFGQNKNMNMISMLAAWRQQNHPHIRIMFTFPVRGHSFLPPDRVFGRIEQDIRARNTILLPEEYHSIISRHGQVHRYQQDWDSLDFKSETTAFIKRARPFKLSEARIVEVGSNGIAVNTSYAGDPVVYSVLKKGRRWENFKPSALPPVTAVKAAKKTDVIKLLSEISAPEEVMDYYRQILGTTAIEPAVNAEDSDDEDY